MENTGELIMKLYPSCEKEVLKAVADVCNLEIEIMQAIKVRLPCGATEYTVILPESKCPDVKDMVLRMISKSNTQILN